MNKDPLGKDQHDTGAKLDAGKPRLGLVLGGFTRALTEVGKVGTKGAAKYTDFGFLEVPNGIDRYTDAMQRHWLTEYIEEYDMGTIEDPGTEELHAACVAWNALARLELIMIEKEKKKKEKLDAWGTIVDPRFLGKPENACAECDTLSCINNHFNKSMELASE